ncbi:hypothetical protein [Candidatus Palauibacter sp.]|uniref:hypothetical protein n=1 Tax=Candidatus Palauibacter sp. TaxID=3101350 RepID=UPI003B528694
MNDPHVVALLYGFRPESSVDYSNAEPLSHEEEAFDLSVADGVARFDLKEHYATEEEARQAVEPFIKKWRLHARLQLAPHSFDLEFKRAIIEDRNPTPGAVSLRGGFSAKIRVGAELTIGAREYPTPPQSAMIVTPDVQSMYERLVRHLEGREPLASMAYFCLTGLEGSTGASKNKRNVAARAYRIEQPILDKIGSLTDRKGGSQARKWKGSGAELDANEVRFLKRAVAAIILRMAEVAADPHRDYPTLRMSDL